MIITIFIPAHAESIGSETPCAWILSDATVSVLRSGVSAIAEIPRATQVWVVIPAARVLFTELALPPVSAARLATLLPFAVEDKLMSDPATIHAVASPVKRGRESVVAVIDKAWLKRVLDILAANGLAAELALPESELSRRDEGEWNVSLRDQEGFLVRDDGFAVAFDFAPGSGPPLALQLALKEAASRRPRLVRVESSDVQLDTSSWPATLGVAIEFATAPPQHKRLVGLVDKAAQRIDFLSGAFAKQSGWKDRIALLRPALAVTVVMLALQFVFSAYDWWRLDSERRSLQAQMTATFKAAFPDARAIVDPVLQMRRNLDTMRRERGITGAGDFQGQLARAAALVEPVGGLSVRRAQWDGAHLTVDIEAPTTEAFTPLQSRLSASGAHSDAQLGPAEKRGDKLVARMQLEGAK